jgi:hypothetical protein
MLFCDKTFLKIKIKISRVLWRKILSYKIGKPFSSHYLAAYEQQSYSKAIFHAADHHMSIKLDELKKRSAGPPAVCCCVACKKSIICKHAAS